MIINVKVVAGAKKEMVKQETAVVKVYVRAPAVEGKANKALIKLLANHFSVRKNSVSILRGERFRLKVISIDTS
ncbi:DUF167 domain-containing protein [Candidatus Omnitrophota bacterium]